MPRPPSEHDEDDLDELPPIDGALGDSPEPGHVLDEAIDDPETDVGDAFDDATGEDDPADTSELEGDESEGGWLEEAADSPELDLGDPMLLDAGEEKLSLDDGEEAPSADEDFGIGELAEKSTLDAAEEGPLGVDEELREEDLPALDADDGPDEEGRDPGEGLLDQRVSSDEPLGIAWAPRPWPRVGAPLGLSGMGLSRGITALACVARGALVAGRSEAGATALVRVDLEGAHHVVGAEGLEGARITALAAEGDWVLAVSEAGRLFLSYDAGERFKGLPVPEGVVAVDAVLASRVLWMRTRTGSLLAGRQGPTGSWTLARCAVPGVVVAVCGDARAGSAAPSVVPRLPRQPPGVNDGVGGILALAVDEGGLPATLVRGLADGSLVPEAVQAPGARPASLVARGGHLAYLAASAKGGVLFRHPGGTQGGEWKQVGLGGRVTALAWVDDAGTLVAASYSETDDSTALVRIDAAGALSVVGTVGPARDDTDADGRVLAMAPDDAHGVIWVAGGFGLAAFALR